jgi:hypothetical protein
MTDAATQQKQGRPTLPPAAPGSTGCSWAVRLLPDPRRAPTVSGSGRLRRPACTLTAPSYWRDRPALGVPGSV